jgi:hypothetical protein
VEEKRRETNLFCCVVLFCFETEHSPHHLVWKPKEKKKNTFGMDE